MNPLPLQPTLSKPSMLYTTHYSQPCIVTLHCIYISFELSKQTLLSTVNLLSTSEHGTTQPATPAVNWQDPYQTAEEPSLQVKAANYTRVNERTGEALLMFAGPPGPPGHITTVTLSKNDVKNHRPVDQTDQVGEAISLSGFWTLANNLCTDISPPQRNGAVSRIEAVLHALAIHEKEVTEAASPT
ncbi:hypothetical protein PoB_007039900 [Plakobranchus ocellatus]|uniref:Uncharacterized protein n=1 Tax=Plakobranchus ocellatus TaxID=259542 RepID=A0AAV4DI37_9GAST|nr:hypothetical protein PoB_007039900 [Plakobranchus ocellatus]